MIVLLVLSLAACRRCPETTPTPVYAELRATIPYADGTVLHFASDSGQITLLTVKYNESDPYKMPASEEDCPTYAEKIEIQIDDDVHVVSYLLTLRHDITAVQIIGEPDTRFSYKLGCETCHSATHYDDSVVVNNRMHYGVFKKQSFPFTYCYSHFTGLIYFKYGNGPGWYRQY